jgi:YVTN family beta-propeller protein
MSPVLKSQVVQACGFPIELPVFCIINLAKIVLTPESRHMKLRTGIFSVLIVVTFAFRTASAQVRIVQTNSGGDNVHLIDPVANAESDSVSAIDAALRKEVSRIPVGRAPKRNIAMVMR